MRRFAHTYAKLFFLVWPHRRGLVVACAAASVVVAVQPFAQAAVTAAIINSLAAGAPVGHALWLAGALAAVTLAWGATQTLYSFLEKVLRFYASERLEVALAQRLTHLDLAAHDDPKKKDLLSRTREQGIWRSEWLYAQAFEFLSVGLRFAVAVAAIAYWSPWAALVVLLATIPEFIAERRAGEEVWGIWSGDVETRRRFAAARSHLDNPRDLIEIRLFQTGRFFWRLIERLFGKFRERQVEAERARLRLDLWAGLAGHLGLGGVLAWFVWRATLGDIEPGTLVFLSAAVFTLHGAVAGLFREIGRARTNFTFAADLVSLLEMPDLIRSLPGAPKVPAGLTPEIIFEDVSFTYPGADRPALGRFSLTIPAGQKLAIVGANGAGKTTFVRLLCRAYDPTVGRILVGGRDLREWDLESWYAHLGVLFQDFSRYLLDVGVAIAVGRNPEKPDLEKARGVAEAADAHSFIAEFPDGYAQQLGRDFTGGVEPSGGQWQKLAIARALYREASVLVLDEPTAAVDAESEAKIFEALESLPDTQTVILISHRFSTVRHADQIVVIEDRTISEAGTHDELLAQGGTYARLFGSQAEGYR